MSKQYRLLRDDRELADLVVASTPSLLEDYGEWLTGQLDSIPGYMLNPDTLYRWTGQLPMNNLERYPLAKGANACIAS